MAFEVLHGAFAALKVNLNAGEIIQAESDAMVTRSANVAIRSKMPGGFMGAAARKLMTGESLFLQELVCTSPAAGTAAGAEAEPSQGSSAGTPIADVLLAPKSTGDIAIHTLQAPGAAGASSASGPLLIRKGAFLAASNSVDITSQAQLGNQFLLKGIFSGHGLFCLRAAGDGVVAFSSCGSIHRYDLRPGEERIVDNDHVIAWSESMTYRIAFQSQSLWHSTASGEGLGCFFTGPGTVFVQSHAPKDMKEMPAAPPLAVRCCLLMFFMFCVTLMLMSVIFLQFQEELQNSPNPGTTSSTTSIARSPAPNADDNFHRFGEL